MAEGYKQGKILEGEGKAANILQEARAVVETLKKIGDSLKRPDGVISEQALRLSLADQYVKAMHAIFSEANIVVLPSAIESQVNSGSPLSASSLATAMSLYKSMLGGPAQYALPSNP